MPFCRHNLHDMAVVVRQNDVVRRSLSGDSLGYFGMGERGSFRLAMTLPDAAGSCAFGSVAVRGFPMRAVSFKLIGRV